MTSCAYNHWAFLPLEMRRRLRAVYGSRGGGWPDMRPTVGRERIAHLADRPRCACVREEVAA